MHVLVSHYLDDLCCKTGLCLVFILYSMIFKLLNIFSKVTQSYLPRVVKPTPPPHDKKKTVVKQTKSE